MFCLKNKFNQICIIVALFLLAGCTAGKEESDFYPIDSLVTKQLAQLVEMKARLHKTALLEGKTDSVSYVPNDTVAWAKELDIFRQLKIINKPVNHGSYLVDDNQRDPSSNLTVKAFTAAEKNLPVRYMKIFYQDSF